MSLDGTIGKVGAWSPGLPIDVMGVGWLPYQANRFPSTNRGVAIETREMTYLSDSRTADSFLASALFGGPSKSRISVFRARVYATSSLVCREVHAPTRPLFGEIFCHLRNRRVD